VVSDASWNTGESSRRNCESNVAGRTNKRSRATDMRSVALLLSSSDDSTERHRLRRWSGELDSGLSSSLRMRKSTSRSLFHNCPSPLASKWWSSWKWNSRSTIG